MGQRVDLHELLKTTLGSSNVYFQPPSTITMKYPCIVYGRSAIDEKFANDELYLSKKCYIVTVMDTNPDSLIPDKVGRLTLCSFDRHYTVNGLNHDVYTLYY